MVLAFHALNLIKDDFRHFHCTVQSIDDALLVLDSVVRRKNRLLKVELVENGHFTQLPSEAFDGGICLDSLKQIELDWKQALNEPINYRSAHKYWLSTIVKKRIDNDIAYISQLQVAIEQVEDRKIQVQNSNGKESYRSRLLSQSDDSIQLYQRLLAKAQARLDASVDQLSNFQK